MTACPSCKRPVAIDVLICPNCGATVTDTSLPTEVLPPSKPRDLPRPDEPTKHLNASVADSADGARFATGTMLTKRYRIVSLLGRGGMGEVYKAEDLKLKQIVALKFLPQAITHDGAALARFHNEVRITRQVSHPNVCRVYDIGEVDGRHFLSMEFIDGEDLSVLLRRIGRLPGDKATEIARHLCAGLAAAHDTGVLHRDLKPANVMIDGRGKARITDFGLAIAAAELSGQEALAGTPGYMAPEQIAGKDLTQQTDIYSLGLVLYELFTGKRVFESHNLNDLIKLHQTSAPPSPSSHVKDTDPLVEKVIRRCLEKDPNKRPSSAIQVAAALPGGDPLAAALAAGETPSPEMVAAAKTEGALRPSFAIALAGAALLMLVAVLLMSDAIGVHNKIPFEKPPEVLQARAAEIVKQLGYQDEPRDYATGFALDRGFHSYVTKNDPSAQRWDKLRSGQPALLEFWYRQGPDYLRPLNARAVVSPSDPPPTAPGMAAVLLDTRGRLIRFSRVPPQVNSPITAAPTPDWNQLFNSAGLDISRFSPTESQWNPPDFSDARAAWQGAYPDHPEVPLHIEAAAYQGKPTYFALIGPWEQPALEKPQPTSISRLISTTVIVMIMLSVLVGGVFLARHNLKLGRGDKKGAFRLALFLIVLGGVESLTHRHVPEIGFEWITLQKDLSSTLFFAGGTWLIYIALEPFVRRRWPDLIISWNRLLAGNYRDPLIGRDILIGAVCGIGSCVLVIIPRLILKLTSKVYEISSFTPVSGGLRMLIHALTDEVLASLIAPTLMLFLCLLVSALLRKRWQVAIVVWVISIARFGFAGDSLAAFLSVAVAPTVLLLVTLRYGWLAACFCSLFFSLMFFYPTTTNFSAWYADSTIFILTISIGLILYGFYTSLAGQKLLRPNLLNE